jgi:phosphoglycolate phosphatase-like HAD superfamily hydrolase
LGLFVSYYKQFKDVIGMSLLPALKQLFNIDNKAVMDVLYTYKNDLNKVTNNYSSFTGVIELLEKLKKQGYLSAVAIGKSRQGLKHN